MQKIFNNKGEGHIDTGVKIIIAVVIGAIVLGGLYLLFIGNGGIMSQVNDNVDQMINTGGTIQLKVESGNLKYSYDGETWKESKTNGIAENSTINNYMTIGEGKNIVHLIAYKQPNGSYCVANSLNATEWSVVTGDDKSVTLSRSGDRIYLNCGDGRRYYTNDGIDWIMTSTAFY